MEELKKLEQVQRMITLMESHGLLPSPNNHYSKRFLANLLLLLIEPCGDLDIKQKCTLISLHVPKLSNSFIAEALLIFNRKEAVLQMENKHGISDDGSRDCEFFVQNNFDDMALVGLDAMQRANSTLEDFCRSYFMFHGIDINKPQSIFKYLPLLSFTESYIYQMDCLNEEIVNMQTEGVGVLGRGHNTEASKSWIGKSVNVFKVDPFRPLVGQLECRSLMTQRIKEELKCGEEYWALERKLCSAVVNQREIAVEDVMRAIHLKSFDYRVLNLLLYQLRREEVNDLHMEFLSISEFLVEVSDDLFDYEDDVLENNFNILRMFVRIYGPLKAPAMLAQHIAEAEEKYDHLLKSLDAQLSLDYQRRCEEATKDGGKISGHPLGTWNIPPVIVDEELYRSNWLNSESGEPLGLEIVGSNGKHG